MSYPGVIERPLLADEFSIYLDNKRPIPLAALATFLGQIDREARKVEGMDGLFLELSGFALGSNEIRCRIVGPGRLAIADAERQERMAAAAESSAKMAKVAAGAGVVSAVAAVVGIAITVGSANSSANKIVNQYNAQHIYVRAPSEPPQVITRDQVEYGRQMRLAQNRRKLRLGQDLENQALLTARDERKVVILAGRIRFEPNGEFSFETMHGNRFPVHFRRAREFANQPIALQTVVQDSPWGLQLDGIKVIAELAEY